MALERGVILHATSADRKVPGALGYRAAAIDLRAEVFYAPDMHTLSSLVILSAMTSAAALGGCKKDDEKTATPPAATVIDAAAAPVAPTEEPEEAKAPPQPTPVEDAADEYNALAAQVIADLGKKDFDAFVKNSMVSREQLKAMMEEGWKACPEMAPTEEQRPAAEQMLADYDPAGDHVKERFDGCLAKHTFAKATFVSATSREHVSMCGGEMADHVELTMKVGKEETVVVLDDLVKTPEGWRLVDMGLSCPDQEAGE